MSENTIDMKLVTNKFIDWNTDAYLALTKHIMKYLKANSAAANKEELILILTKDFDDSLIAEMLKLYSYRLLTYYMHEVHKCRPNRS